MTKELQQIIEYNNRIERKRRNRLAAAMVFSSAILYLLMKSL